MTAVAKLLPCPFCGSQPKSGWQGASVPGMEDCGYWGIDCCNAFAHAGSEQDAAAQWNRRAALSPAELGGVELDEAERRSRDQRAMGWDAICDLLFELRPDWVNGAGTGIECAVAVIRDALSTPRATEAVTEYEYEVWQNGEWQAGGSCTDIGTAKEEAGHYATMYGQDGPVVLRLYEKREITEALTPPSAKGE